ncbi:hypothetical protein L484_007515 [Morus notabilis]|uniref:Uncharacterized protein n=1 Tax=Morus notabilis TaxID=981085 RepID=W9SD42_9ROSA|nr:hypothetical protein L484_007515 [Morus notabilis]
MISNDGGSWPRSVAVFCNILWSSQLTDLVREGLSSEFSSPWQPCSQQQRSSCEMGRVLRGEIERDDLSQDPSRCFATFSGLRSSRIWFAKASHRSLVRCGNLVLNNNDHHVRRGECSEER